MSSKLSGLSAVITPTVADFLYLAYDPAGADLSKKITFANFEKSLTLANQIGYSGLLTLDQTVGQTIGVTGARLTKLWATDVTVTNAIVGSVTGNAATVTTNANLTGVITSAGNATSIASQTGTGTKFVVDTSPTLVTPILGVATATSINKVAFTAPTTSATFAFGTDNTTQTFQGTDTIVGRATTDTLTNKRITKRVITASDATSVTPNSDNADVTYQLNTQALGTLTINADAGSPTNAQSWMFKIKSTNVQTFSWTGTSFVGGTTPLPTATTGGGKIDYYSFIYDTVNSRWHFTGSALNLSS